MFSGGAHFPVPSSKSGINYISIPYMSSMKLTVRLIEYIPYFPN
jgi:hypothetical protein